MTTCTSLIFVCHQRSNVWIQAKLSRPIITTEWWQVGQKLVRRIYFSIAESLTAKKFLHPAYVVTSLNVIFYQFIQHILHMLGDKISLHPLVKLLINSDLSIKKFNLLTAYIRFHDSGSLKFMYTRWNLKVHIYVAAGLQRPFLWLNSFEHASQSCKILYVKHEWNF